MQVDIFSDIKLKYRTEKKLIKLIYFILFSGTILIYCIDWPLLQLPCMEYTV